MSSVIIGGQVLSLVLTLVAIPVIYSYFDDLQRAGVTGWLTRLFARRRAGGGPAMTGAAIGPNAPAARPGGAGAE